MPRTVFIKKNQFFNGQREITLIFQTGPVEYQRFQSHFVLKELLSSFKINDREREKLDDTKNLVSEINNGSFHGAADLAKTFFVVDHLLLS